MANSKRVVLGLESIHRSAFALVTMATTAIAFAGCSAGDQGDSAETRRTRPDVSAAEQPSASGATASVLNGTIVDGEYVSQYSLANVTGLSAGELKLTWEADERLRAECMAARGFDYAEVPAPSIVSATDMVRLTSDPTVAELEQYGYEWKLSRRVSMDDEESSPSDGGVPVSTTVEYAAALFGDDSGGDISCVEVATEALKAREYEAAEQPFFAAFNDIGGGVDADPQMADVLDAWVQCVQAQGFEVTHNIESGFLSQADGVDGWLPGQEQVAIADYGCREQVGYSQLRVKLINQKSEEWLAANPAAVAAYNEAKAEYLSRSKEALE